jgi:hypothetical protein
MNSATTVSSVPASRDAGRQRRREVRALRRQLRSYTTGAAINDLLAAADRSEGPDADTIRSILTDNATRRLGYGPTLTVAF